MKITRNPPIYTLAEAATMRTCQECLRMFPATAEYFGRDTHRRGGLRVNCKVCQRRLDRQRYKERIRARADLVAAA